MKTYACPEYLGKADTNGKGRDYYHIKCKAYTSFRTIEERDLHLKVYCKSESYCKQCKVYKGGIIRKKSKNKSPYSQNKTEIKEITAQLIKNAMALCQMDVEIVRQEVVEGMPRHGTGQTHWIDKIVGVM
jgi:hypothetical protein